MLNIGKYITEILKVFGIKTADEIGFPISEGSSSNDVSITHLFVICLHYIHVKRILLAIFLLLAVVRQQHQPSMRLRYIIMLVVL